MERATGKDDPGRCNRKHLRAAGAADAVIERGAAVHRDRLTPTELGAVAHEEVRLHPTVSLRRYRNWRRVATIPGSKPGDHEIALGGRRC